MAVRQRPAGQAPTYFIHPSDLPLERLYTEKPSRVPTFGIDVAGVSILCSVFAFLLLAAATRDLITGLGFAGLVGLGIAVWRTVRMLDDPFVIKEDAEYQRVFLDMTSDPRMIPVMQAGQHRGDVVIRPEKRLEGGAGHYTFTGRQLDRLTKNIEDGYEYVRRDTSAEGPGLADIGIRGGNYSIVLALFREKKYVDENNRWTFEGKQWVFEV